VIPLPRASEVSPGSGRRLQRPTGHERDRSGASSTWLRRIGVCRRRALCSPSSTSVQALVSTPLHQQLQATLGDSYTLERELGGGGMARVFLAEETALGRRVVVKVLAPDVVQELSAERFAREIRSAPGSQHPNIVPVLRAGVAGGVPTTRCRSSRVRRSVRAWLGSTPAMRSPSRSGGDPPRHGAGARVRARPGCRPPRRQAGEHPPSGRCGRGRRFRDRQGGGRRALTGRGRHRGRGRRDAHPARRRARYAGLHGARGRRRATRRRITEPTCTRGASSRTRCWSDATRSPASAPRMPSSPHT
jgi:hypothetical protein